LCHTVVASTDESGKLSYTASSPDELALINFSRFCGFEFLGTDENQWMTVKVSNISHKYKLVHVLEFNSTRKRMSVIVQNDTGEYILYTKGADSIIEPRLVREGGRWQ
jgi:phospholipid-transporting ATPase